MTITLVLDLDRDSAGQLAVALHALGSRNRQQRRVFPAALGALQAAAENVVQTNEPMRLSISNAHEASPAITRRTHTEDDIHDRELLTRNDVAQFASVGIATVDRWIASGRLASHKVGRIRRIRRSDLDRFLKPAA